MRFCVALAAFLAAFVFAAGGLSANQLVITLEDLARAYADDPRTEDVTIDTLDLSLKVTRIDGSTFTNYPDNLNRLLDKADNAAERTAIIAAYVNMLMTPGAATAPVNPDRLMPVIRPAGYGRDVVDTPPLSQPFVAGMSIFIVEEQQASARFITENLADEAALSFETLLNVSLDNMKARGLRPQINGDGIYVLSIDGYYEASYLLATPLWQQLDTELGTIVAAAPARDVIVFTDATIPGAVDDMTRMIAAVQPGMAHPLSNVLLQWSDDRWVLHF